MAWEEFDLGSVRGMTGDAPHDEMRQAVNSVNRAYLERFGRRPYLAELLFALEGVIGTDPPAYVSDDVVPELQTLLSCVANSPYEHIDPIDYEGMLDGETHDFLIAPAVDTSGRPFPETVLVRGQVLPNSETDIVCRYTILSNTITDGMVKSLIRLCVLQDLLDYNIVDGGLVIRFERRS